MGLNTEEVRRKSKEEITAHLSSLHLGMKRKSVDIKPYQSEWQAAFEWVKNKIESFLPAELLFRIEHVGSTSIPGLSSKLILDVLAIFENRSELEASIPWFEKLGFTYKGDAVSRINQAEADPNRHFFSFYDNEETTDFVHLHVFCSGHPHINRFLIFRDALRADQSLVEKYQALKMALWKEGKARGEYTRSKDGFIRGIVEGCHK